MNKEEIEKAKIGLWNIRADCLKIIQCGLSDRQDREGCLKEIDTIDDIFKYIKQLEQKSETLDKVTDKLKEGANQKIPLAEDKDWVICRKQYAREILNIIEGEKK